MFYTHPDDHPMGRFGIEPEGPPIITDRRLPGEEWRIATPEEVAEYQLWWNTRDDALDAGDSEDVAEKAATDTLAEHRKKG